MIRIFLISVLVIIINTYALTQQQKEVIYKIKHYAIQYPDNKGYNYKTILLAIANVESSFCKNIIGDVRLNTTILNASLGCFQFRIKTAKWLIKKDKRLHKYRNWSDWKIANHLINDLRFQVELTSYFVQYLLNRYGRKGLWHYNGSKKYQIKLEKAIIQNRRYLK